MSAARTLRRNANTTSVTSITDASSVSSTSRSDVRMGGVRSRKIDRSMAAGSVARSRGMSARARSTVSMMLAFGLRNRTTTIAGLPFAKPAVRMSSTESLTVATSEMRSTAPPERAITTGRKSSARIS
jgi:hypothetical protein